MVFDWVVAYSKQVHASQAAKESKEEFEKTDLKARKERAVTSHLAASGDSELSQRIRETLSRNSHLLVSVSSCEHVPQVRFLRWS